MGSDPASRDRIAALVARGTPSVSPSSSSSSSSPSSPSSPSPDPEFWGHESRALRRRRSVPDDPGRGAPVGWAMLRDRIQELRLEVGIGVVAIALVALVAGVVWYRMGAGAPGAPAARTAARAPGSASPTEGTPTTAAASTVTRGGAIVVHVAGAVMKPGVLLMPAGARVIDAIEGAGGATPEADLDRLNLAAKLVDGQRVLVVKVGAPVTADPGVTSGAAGGGDPAALLDLNTATSAQLEAIPGIGPALAGAIIAERDRRGGFRSVNELREVRGIGEARFADLRARVTV